MPTYPGAIAFELFTSPAPNPLIEGFQEGGSTTPVTNTQACAKSWGVEEIKLSAGGGTSTSYGNRDHAEIAAGRAGHFWFAPTEDSVSVTWKLHNGAHAETMVMELFRAGSGRPIWRCTFDAAGARKLAFDEAWKGELPAAEWIDTVDFPHHMVTAECSPYMLKIRAEGRNVEDGYVERFTYFDVLVEAVELEWGGPALIPNVDLPNVHASLRVDTHAAEQQLVTDLAGGAITAARIPVVLSSDRFVTASAELKGDHAFQSHRDQWGDGPRIPLKAKISLAKAGGGAVHGGDSAKALGKLELLWDWEGEDETTQLGADFPAATVRTYLQNRLTHKRNDGNCPHDSTNCHVDFGGKRGDGGVVFPTANGAFPFMVTACGTRKWAATSVALTDGPHAGCSGAIFQPSRFARDTFKVTAYLSKISGQRALDVVTDAAVLRNTHADLPRSATGMFEIRRRVNARYIRKAPSIEASNPPAASAEHLRAGVTLHWTSNEDGAFQASYVNYIDRIRNRQLVDKDNVVSDTAGNPVTDWIVELEEAIGGIGQDPASTHAAVTLREYVFFKRRMRVHATRDYVLNKARKINGPRKAYARWRNGVGAAADDTAWLTEYYRDLSNEKKAKVDAILNQMLTDLGVATKDEYENRCGLLGFHIFKQAGTQYMIETANGGNRGFITFHAVDKCRFVNHAGAYRIVPSDTGGLAPSFETLRERRHAMLLIMIPHTVRNIPNEKYGVSAQAVIAHEMGHTFFLGHAPAANPTFHGPMYSAAHHDPADLLCLMNYDWNSDHLCGLCNLKLRGWSLRGLGVVP